MNFSVDGPTATVKNPSIFNAQLELRTCAGGQGVTSLKLTIPARKGGDIGP
jgi:hypothetical protein